MKEAFLEFLEKEKNKLSINGGVFLSFVVHLLFFIASFLALERAKDNSAQASQVFTVTLEGGQKIGGITQVPKKGKNELKVGSKKEDKSKAGIKDTEIKEKKIKNKAKSELEFKKKIAKAKEVKKKELKKKELAKKKLAAKKKAEKAEKAKKLLKKKKEEAKKKLEAKKLSDKKKLDKEKLAQAKKRKAEREKNRELREKRLAEIARKVRANVYDGESTNAGGQGFGAAKLGGNGMGGGALASAEKVAYANALQQHVKSGWRWLAARDKLRALVLVEILPDGRIRSVEIAQSSGNKNFDDSILRAVKKANPVPAAPATIYNDFRTVRFWFDSSESS